MYPPQQFTSTPVRRSKAERCELYEIGSWLVTSWTAVKSFQTAIEDEPAVTSPSTVLVAFAVIPVSSFTLLLAEVGDVVAGQRRHHVLVQRELDDLAREVEAQQQPEDDEERPQPSEGQPEDTTHRSPPGTVRQDPRRLAKVRANSGILLASSIARHEPFGHITVTCSTYADQVSHGSRRAVVVELLVRRGGRRADHAGRRERGPHGQHGPDQQRSDDQCKT